jgi:hypothetical protein
LVELHAELLHPNRGNADHRSPLDGRILPARRREHQPFFRVARRRRRRHRQCGHIP